MNQYEIKTKVENGQPHYEIVDIYNNTVVETFHYNEYGDAL